MYFIFILYLRKNRNNGRKCHLKNTYEFNKKRI